LSGRARITAKSRNSLGGPPVGINPWDGAAANTTAGTKVKGQVRNLTSYGAFVELEEGIDGMIHVFRYVMDAQNKIIRAKS